MRPPDKYEQRARELAIAAGLNPDDRVGEGRGMPVWCTFRAAARQEHVVKEAGAVELPPQAPQYQNSPLKVFGEHEDGTLAQMRNCMAVGNVVAGTICADGHLGYAQPVGGVIAYEGQISISGVGFDIGCGNMAIRLDTPYAAIQDRVGEIIRDVAKVISFGVGRKNEERVEHALFDDGEAWRASDMEAYRPKAAGQLGTVGSGNHYVDLLHDAEGLVWIGVHFGSRGLGHTSATRYLKAAGGKDGMNVPPAVIDEASELGQRYIAAMELGRALRLCGPRMGVRARAQDHRRRRDRPRAQSSQLRLARAPQRPRPLGGAQGRDAGVPGPARFRRRLDGRRCGDHRRASTARKRAPRFTRPFTAPGACSAAGRRSAASRATQMDAWLTERGVVLVGADLDESPMAYRRLPDVLAHHAGSIRVLHTLRPFAVAMAGEGEFDPFKD